MAKKASSSPFYLVTGAAGFIGARTVESLRRDHLPVISVDQLSYFDERREHKDLDFGMLIERMELFDYLKSENPPLAAVIHLGACTDTTEMDWNYLKTMNIQYSQQLWNHCREQGVPFVYASSAATYGDGSLGYEDNESEMQRLRPLNPYGQSKLDFDLWALAEEKKGRSPKQWSGFKFFNVYGYGERHKDKMSSVVLQSFDQIRKNGQVTLFESHREGIAHGMQQRDFISVQDVVAVLRFALEKPIVRGIYNLGTGQARSFLDLAHAAFQALKVPAQIRFTPTPEHLRERYQYFTQADMRRLRAAGYSTPFQSLETGILDTYRRMLQ